MKNILVPLSKLHDLHTLLNTVYTCHIPPEIAYINSMLVADVGG